MLHFNQYVDRDDAPLCSDMEQIHKRKIWYQKSKNKYIWAIVDALFILPLTLDMAYGVFQNYYFVPRSVIICIEAVFNSVFIFSFFYNLHLFLWPSFEPRFTVHASVKEVLDLPCAEEDLKYWKYLTDMDLATMYRRHRKHASLQLGQNFVPESYWKHYYSPRNGIIAPNAPRPYERIGLPFISCKRSPDMHELLRGSIPCLETDTHFHDYPGNFGRQQENKRSSLLSWLANRRNVPTAINYFHRAPKLPSLPLDNFHQGSPSSSGYDPPSHCSDNVWTKQRVSEQMLGHWCEKLKMWICLTIINRLVEAVNQVNKKLEENGFSEMKIGEVNLFTLKQFIFEKWQDFPELAYIYPFLEVSLNQEYVVQRWKDLASSCMRVYKWDSGRYDSKTPLYKYSPYDSMLVMHLLCSYFDRIMIFDKNTFKKTYFTSNHFKQIPYKPDFVKGKHYIYQRKQDPPHYAVVIDDEIYELPKGQNNLFFAVLLFFHYIKTKENGIIGRINLGPSGLNILGVLDW